MIGVHMHVREGCMHPRSFRRTQPPFASTRLWNGTASSLLALLWFPIEQVQAVAIVPGVEVEPGLPHDVILHFLPDHDTTSTLPFINTIHFLPPCQTVVALSVLRGMLPWASIMPRL